MSHGRRSCRWNSQNLHCQSEKSGGVTLVSDVTSKTLSSWRSLTHEGLPGTGDTSGAEQTQIPSTQGSKGGVTCREEVIPVMYSR